MNVRIIEEKIRKNTANGQLNVNLTKGKFSREELDRIQKKGTIKFLMEEDE